MALGKEKESFERSRMNTLDTRASTTRDVAEHNGFVWIFESTFSGLTANNSHSLSVLELLILICCSAMHPYW
jgi:hypothetical protein